MGRTNEVQGVGEGLDVGGYFGVAVGVGVGPGERSQLVVGLLWIVLNCSYYAPACTLF